MSPDASDAFVDRIEAHWDQRGWGLWAVEVPAVAPFVGYVGLWPADIVRPGAVEVGWRLVRAHWGHGYATEAARAALRFGFERLGLAEIVSFTVPQNVRSRRVMERIRLTRDPDADFDHPRVDPLEHPELVVTCCIGLIVQRGKRRPSQLIHTRDSCLSSHSRHLDIQPSIR